jgi:hypothetical protein
MTALVRWFSYLFHAVLALFLMGIAAVSLASGQPLHLTMLPLEGAALAPWLLCAAFIGLISVALAIARRWRGLFLLWSLLVLLVCIQGFFFSHYHFGGSPAFHHALLWVGGSLIAVCGAWSQLRRQALR